MLRTPLRPGRLSGCRSRLSTTVVDVYTVEAAGQAIALRNRYRSDAVLEYISTAAGAGHRDRRWLCLPGLHDHLAGGVAEVAAFADLSAFGEQQQSLAAANAFCWDRRAVGHARSLRAGPDRMGAMAAARLGEATREGQPSSQSARPSLITVSSTLRL
jgi:hypothetical protein